VADRLRRARLAVTTVLVSAAFQPAAALEVTLVQPADGHWTSQSEAIVLHVERAAEDAGAKLAVFVGKDDLTPLFRATRKGNLRLNPGFIRLPAGEQKLRVYLVRSASDWQQAGEFPLRVLQPSGFEEAAFEPRLEISEKSQFSEGASADAGAAARSNYNDFAGQAGITTRARRGAFEMRSAWNLVGSSVTEEALRFGVKDDAPQIDLSDYLVEFDVGRAQLGVGHVSYGSQPLLMDGLSHRGLVYRQELGRVDFSVSAQSGQAITGYSDLLGVTRSDNYIGGATAGFEFLRNRPGDLRLEVMYIKSEVLSDLSFNTGEVPDAVENSGYGVRVSGSSPGGRIRGSVEYARSDYTNPDDPVLAQGSELVPVEQGTESARGLDLAIDLLQNRPITANTDATVTLGFRHSRADPLYRTVASSIFGDQESNTGSLAGSIGLVSFHGEFTRLEDNLDDIPTILKTRSENLSLSYGLPLRGIFAGGDGDGPAWLPDNFAQSYLRSHQKGINRPPSFDPLTHIPDQVTENHDINLGWTFSRVNLNYAFSLGKQDNRQPGRAFADFESISHGVSVGLQLTDDLNVSLGAGITDASDDEQDVTRTTDSYTLDIDWRFFRRLGFRGSYSLTDVDDDRGLAEDHGWTSLTELNARFDLPLGRGRKLPGQLYLRHAAQGNQITDSIFDLATYSRNWAFTGGFTISLF